MADTPSRVRHIRSLQNQPYHIQEEGLPGAPLQMGRDRYRRFVIPGGVHLGDCNRCSPDRGQPEQQLDGLRRKSWQGEKRRGMRPLESLEGRLQSPIRDRSELVQILDRVEQARAQPRRVEREGHEYLLGYGRRPPRKGNQADAHSSSLLTPIMVGGKGRIR